MNTRRKFISKVATGMAGLIAAPALGVAPGNSFKALNTNRNDEAFWRTVKSRFKFTDGLHYFNNASLGPSPLPVRQATDLYRATLDEFPSKYMWGGWQDDKEATRTKVAELLKADTEEVALIHNTTEGMNLIARSLELQPGDEVILADHEHASGTICWQVWQEQKGIKLVRPTLPIIPNSVDEIVEVYKQAITEKTRVISMCHIVNTNGMILPVKEVSAMAHEKGILVAVDGAQSAGMLDLDLPDLGCDFYAASSHKWLFSPKGVGVFYSRLESQHYLKPLIVARGHKDQSIRRLENYNTRNLPELLGLGSSVDFINVIGIQKLEARTFELKEYFKAKVENNPKFKIKTPGLNEQSAAIQVVEVIGKDVRDVRGKLLDEYGIDCRPMSNFDLNAIRLSFAIYITKEDIDYLVRALEAIAA